MLPQKLKDLRAVKGISQANLANFLGVTQQAVAKWEKSKAEPDSKTLKQIADYFNVSTDYLLDHNNKTDAPHLNEKQHELITGYEELDDEGRILLMSILKSLKAAHTRLAR